MEIKSAVFIKGIVGTDDILDDGKPQIAFIGRSNVGKSSTINSLVKQGNLARTSSYPGRTQEINLFLINKSFYLVDLPGYGYTRTSKTERAKLQKRIYWYLLDSDYTQKAVVLIVDANVGLTEDDARMIYSLEEKGKNLIIIANKIDKIKKSDYAKKMEKLQEAVGEHKIIPYSAEKKTGVGELLKEILK
ncbi:MAG: ribosome biogenesis GTP-binding protein YsxC, GTP-binding protein [Candidatus Peregrinibacteria bacterium GW2011_GWF2_38_29]|nr:MAG: ribosome biogenesis GTP-binding protein YsxC, GTP-binding protein [Candidatus Peregrinibacteria bacterium GW2011_GWF2_38_29]HBB02197.1 YihA family ribosome biogenesis GTP-binding protein [Candidatus Peregrinibacteria bacterium]